MKISLTIFDKSNCFINFVFVYNFMQASKILFHDIVLHFGETENVNNKYMTFVSPTDFCNTFQVGHVVDQVAGL